MGDIVTPKFGMDDRFALSRKAMLSVMAVMCTRWPQRAEQIESWRETYIELMVGQRPGDKPLLTPEEILNIAREVMGAWKSPSFFPLPSMFGERCDEFRRNKHNKHSPGDIASNKRDALIDAACRAGSMYRRWSYVYDLYPADERYYRGVSPSGDLMFKENGEDWIMDHWVNAEHFRSDYSDAVRELTGDMEAHRIIESYVSSIAPWTAPEPAAEGTERGHGFSRVVTRETLANIVPGGPGERAGLNATELAGEESLSAARADPERPGEFLE